MKAPRRIVISSWPFHGWSYQVECKLSCGHIITTSYRHDKAPKTVSCHKCARTSISKAQGKEAGE
jgi:ribulose bisphosphate carboxylase small subunit